MRIFAILAFLFCTFFPYALHAESGIATLLFRPAAESYTDQTTGLVFPSVIGEFTKNRVTMNKIPGIGTTVRYVNEMGPCADVYIFAPQADPEKAIPEDEFKLVFSSTSATICNLSKQGGTVQKVVQQSADDLKTDETVPHLKAFFRIESKTEPLDSLLIMARKGNRIIKIRISWSAGVQQEQDDSVSFANTVLQIIGNAMTQDKVDSYGKSIEKKEEKEHAGQ